MDADMIMTIANAVFLVVGALAGGIFMKVWKKGDEAVNFARAILDATKDRQISPEEWSAIKKAFDELTK